MISPLELRTTYHSFSGYGVIFSSKHKIFIKQLLEQKIARIFDKSAIALDKYSYKPLNEAERVAETIIALIKSWFNYMNKDIQSYKLINKLESLPFVIEIWLFGSRAKRDNDERSDIDIAIIRPNITDEEWLE